MKKNIDSQSRDQGMMAIGIGLIILGVIWFLSLERIKEIKPSGLSVATIESYTSTQGKYPQVILNLKVSYNNKVSNSQVYLSSREFIQKQEELKINKGDDVLVEVNLYRLSNKSILCIDSLRKVNDERSIIFQTAPRTISLFGSFIKLIDCSELKG